MQAEREQQARVQELHDSYSRKSLALAQRLAGLYLIESQMISADANSYQLACLRFDIRNVQFKLDKALADELLRPDKWVVSASSQVALYERFTDMGNRGHSLRRRPTLDYYDNRRDGVVNGRHYFGIYSKSYL